MYLLSLNVLTNKPTGKIADNYTGKREESNTYSSELIIEVLKLIKAVLAANVNE